VRQPVIGIMDGDLIAFDKTGRKDHQVGATGVTLLSMRAIWRQAQSHSCQALSQISGSNPCERSATSGERDLVGGKRCRRDDAGALLVFVKSRLGRTRQIECFDAWPVETTAVDRRACTADGQESPFGCQIAIRLDRLG